MYLEKAYDTVTKDKLQISIREVPEKYVRLVMNMYKEKLE